MRLAVALQVAKLVRFLGFYVGTSHCIMSGMSFIHGLGSTSRAIVLLQSCSVCRTALSRLMQALARRPEGSRAPVLYRLRPTGERAKDAVTSCYTVPYREPRRHSHA